LGAFMKKWIGGTVEWSSESCYLFIAPLALPKLGIYELPFSSLLNCNWDCRELLIEFYNPCSWPEHLWKPQQIIIYRSTNVFPRMKTVFRLKMERILNLAHLCCSRWFHISSSFVVALIDGCSDGIGNVYHQQSVGTSKQGLWLGFGNLVTFARSFEWMFTNFFNCMLGQRWCQWITVSAVSGLGGDSIHQGK
jgi:hypothetical protein